MYYHVPLVSFYSGLIKIKTDFKIKKVKFDKIKRIKGLSKNKTNESKKGAKSINYSSPHGTKDGDNT